MTKKYARIWTSEEFARKLNSLAKEDGKTTIKFTDELIEELEDMRRRRKKFDFKL